MIRYIADLEIATSMTPSRELSGYQQHPMPVHPMMPPRHPTISDNRAVLNRAQLKWLIDRYGGPRETVTGADTTWFVIYLNHGYRVFIMGATLAPSTRWVTAIGLSRLACAMVRAWGGRIRDR